MLALVFIMFLSPELCLRHHRRLRPPRCLCASPQRHSYLILMHLAFPSTIFLSPKRGFFWMWFQAKTSSSPLPLQQSLLFSNRLLRLFAVSYSLTFSMLSISFLSSPLHFFPLLPRIHSFS